MISYIDEILELWAEERQGGGSENSSGMAGNVIAALMTSQGVLNRSARGSRVLVNRAAEVEWIVSKHLTPEQRQVVTAQYCDSGASTAKWTACGCSRAQFYRRLGQAHRAIESQLLKRAA